MASTASTARMAEATTVALKLVGTASPSGAAEDDSAVGSSPRRLRGAMVQKCPEMMK